MKKKTDSISRRTFISDTGKTLFFTAIAASVIPTFVATSCTKGGIFGGGDDNTTGQLTVSDDGLKKACAHDFVCDDVYTCGKGSFNCNHCFYCAEQTATGGFDCGQNNFHCHNDGYGCGDSAVFDCGEAFNCHNGGQGG